MDRRIALKMLISGGAVLSASQQVAFGQTLQQHLRSPARALRSLDKQQNDMVVRIAEMILPETETPGATSIRINEFIDLLLTESLSSAERTQFLAGLTEIDQRSVAVHGSSFVKLPGAEQVKFLTVLDEAALATPTATATSDLGATGVRANKASPEQAFRAIKTLTIYGYFTSREVMQDILKSPIIPGRDQGCIHV